MTKLEEAELIVQINNEIKRLTSRLNFIREGRYQDEFLLGYSETNEVTRYNSMELIPWDIERLRDLWITRKDELEVELKKLLK